MNRRYRVVRQLGAGGMGEVYLVQDTLDEDQLLALKTIRTGVTSAYTYNAFRSEFQAMTQFRHPNVVEVYEFGTLGPHEDFFTMEVVEGQNLFEATRHASLERIYDYALQAGRALEYIHSQGFIHFDLKPDNIMVRRDGTVKVMDFGLVEDFAHISQGKVRGSVHYLAPEMVRGGPLDHRFDLYSLGAVLFHIIAGRPLYEGSVAEVLHHHVSGEPDFERQVRRPFPPGLRALLLRLLAREPAERLPRASDFLVELARLAGRQDGGGGGVLDSADGYVLGSRFVGREAQLVRLKQAFQARVVTPGAGLSPPPLLVLSGPAGIGRSRLAQEFRHHVQLCGVRFAHGSSIEDGGQPYLPFSEILRALVREILPAGEGVELSSFREARLGSIRLGPPTSGAAARGFTATTGPTELTVPGGPPALSPTAAPTLPVAEGALTFTLVSEGPGEEAGGPEAAAAPASRPVPELPAGLLREQIPTVADPAAPARRPAPPAAVAATAATAEPDDVGDIEESPDSSSLGVIYAARPGPLQASPAGPGATGPSDGQHAALLEVLRSCARALSRLLPDQEGLRALARGATDGPPSLLPGPLPLAGGAASFGPGGAASRPPPIPGGPSFATPQAEKEWLMDSITRFLVDAARVRPLVLYLSDLQWADDLTVELLSRLSRALAAPEPGAAPPRFLLLGCYRSDEGAGRRLEPALTDLVRRGQAETIDLSPMNADELLQMLQSMLGPVSLTPRAVEALVERTGGVPFLIEATVRGLLEQGGIGATGVPFDVGALAQQALGLAPASVGPLSPAPIESVDQVLDRTLSRLGPGELAILQVLAVFNRPASAVVLQLAAPDVDDLPRLLSTLQKKRFLQRGWADGSYQYRLRHNQLRAHLYRGLSPRAQLRLHQRAGEALEARYPGSERYLEELSQHFLRAGAWDQGLRYARLAADQARLLHDHRRAVALYQDAWRALAALPDAPERRRDRAELAVAIAEVSYYAPSEQGVERLQRAAALASELGDPDLKNQVQHWLGRSYYALGRHREAIRCFQEFMKGTAGSDDDFTRALPFAVLGRVHFFLGRFEAARDYLARGLSLLRPIAGADEEVSYALAMSGAARAFLGELGGGLVDLDESIALARRINHPSRVALGTIYRGACLAHHGRFAEAGRDLDEGLALCERTGDLIGTGVGSSFRGQVHLAAGNAEEAERLARRGREVIARAGGTWTFSMIGTHLAEALLARGQPDAALAVAEETRAVFEVGERWGESCLHLALGRIHAARGQASAAHGALATALDVAREQQARPFEAKAHLALGQFLLATGRLDEGHGELLAASELFEQLEMGWHRERALAALAGEPPGPCP